MTRHIAAFGAFALAALAPTFAEAASYSTLYTFTGSNGAEPTGGLISYNGLLYGNVPNGGSEGMGLVFSLTLQGQLTVLHSFVTPAGGGPSARLTRVGGNLYGTGHDGTVSSNGSAIRVPLTGGTGTDVLYSFGEKTRDGAYPESGVIKVGKLLYGTTSLGGASNLGTVFSITLSGREKVIYSFAGGKDGADPYGGLLDVGGVLYGTTAIGGSTKCKYQAGCGTVFSVTADGAETVLHVFDKPVDGSIPLAGLTEMGGTLFGTASFGGPGNCSFRQAGGCGTVFSIKPDGSGFTVLHVFGGGADGAQPQYPLLNVAGSLYGTCVDGGSSSGGTIFKLDPTTGTFTTLYALSGTEAYPSSGLFYLGGVFYGETYGNGVSSQGVIYAFTP